MTNQPAPTLPNIPWEDRPAGSSAVIWRYSANPIIPRDLIPSANSIFNSAAVPYLLAPQTLYECVGDVPNVAFPCAALHDPPTGRIALYYGGADTVTARAFCKLDDILDWLKVNSA